jgi:hypothetical protein
MAVKKEAPHIPTNYAVVDLSYIGQQVVMTIDEATALLKALEHAETYERKGYGDESKHYIGNSLRDSVALQVSVLSESAYLMGKLAGPKPTEEK